MIDKHDNKDERDEEKRTENKEILKRIFREFEVINYDLNRTVFVCILKPKYENDVNYEESNEIVKYLKDSLYDTLLDIRDGLAKAGLNLPVVTIIKCSQDDYNIWHEIAGDQDWHRGDFSIIPCKVDNNKNEDECKEIFEQLKNDINVKVEKKYHNNKIVENLIKIL